MSEEKEEEMRSQFREEIADYNIFVEEYSPAKSRTDLLLFIINKNLGRIAESLDVVAEHFDFVDNKKITP